MKFNSRGFIRNSSLLLLFGYFLSFTVYYLADYLFYSSDALAYAEIFVSKATYLLLPILAGLVALICDGFIGRKYALLSLISTTLARLIYFIPYYYLVFIYDDFDSAESILFALLASLAEAILAYCFTLIIYLLMSAVIKHRLTGRDSLRAALEKKTTLDFGNPVSLAFACVSLLAFLYFIGTEIYDTVAFIVDYSGRFTSFEIIYTVTSYIFDVLLLAVHYLSLSFAKNKILEKRLYAPIEG